MRNFLLVFLLFLAVPVSSYGKEEVYKTYTDIGELEPAGRNHLAGSLLPR